MQERGSLGLPVVTDGGKGMCLLRNSTRELRLSEFRTSLVELRVKGFMAWKGFQSSSVPRGHSMCERSMSLAGGRGRTCCAWLRLVQRGRVCQDADGYIENPVQ